MANSQPPQGTQAVIRAIKLLKAFTPAKPELSLSELCEIIGLTKTTTHRLLSALESEGLLGRNKATSTYNLGPTIIALGSQAMLTSNLCASVRPVLEELANQTGETATLETLVGNQMLVLDGVVGRHMVSASLDIGTRWPVHATSTGKALLATMAQASRDRLLRLPLTRFTEHTITDMEALNAELVQVRERGYAATFQELEKDYVGVAAEFRGPLGNVQGRISIGGPASRFTKRRVRSLGIHLRAAADGLSCRYEEQADPLFSGVAEETESP